MSLINKIDDIAASIFPNKKRTYIKIITDLDTIKKINNDYTDRLIEIKKHIICTDNYLKTDYTLRKNDARMIDYNKYLFDEINRSINQTKADIGPENDLDSRIADKIKRIDHIIENRDYKTNRKKYADMNEITKDSEKFLEKIKKKDREFKDKEKDIEKINQLILTYIKGFQRFKDCKTFKEFCEENRKEVQKVYRTIETEYSIARTIYSKRTISLPWIRKINTNLANIKDYDYCFERTIDSMDSDEMFASFQNILGYIKPDGTFHFHTKIQNILKHIDKNDLLNSDELSALKQLTDQTFKP